MESKRLQQIQRQIKSIKRELERIGEMRPGSLSRQYRIPKKQIGGYYQLSYTHKMKSHTEYVRPRLVKEVRRQIATYKRFKQLTEEWIVLGIEECKLKMDIAKRRRLR